MEEDRWKTKGVVSNRRLIKKDKVRQHKILALPIYTNPDI